MRRSAKLLALTACVMTASAQAAADTAKRAEKASSKATSAAAAPALDCKAALTGTWLWSGTNRALKSEDMSALEMETSMELRADGQSVKRQRSRAQGEDWFVDENRDKWSAKASGSSDRRQCTLSMEGGSFQVTIVDQNSISLVGTDITYRRQPS